MKKLTTIILSVLLFACSFVVNISANEVQVGLYFVPNVEEFTQGNYNSLSDGIGIVPGEFFETGVVFYDGTNYINVAEQVTLSNNGSFLTSEVIEVGTTNKVKALKLTASALGGPAKLTYNNGTEYTLENINVSYPSLFVINEGRYEGGTSLRVGEKRTIDLQVSSNGQTYVSVDKTEVGVENTSVCTFNTTTGELEALAQGDTELTYPNPNDEMHPFTFHVSVFEDQPGGPEFGNDVFRFTYGDVDYMLGFGNGSGDGGTMHIDGGSQVNINDDPCKFAADILIGKVNDQGQISEPAASSVYALFSDFSYELVGEDKAGISFTTGTEEAFGVSTTKVEITVNRETVTQAQMHVTFKYSLDGGTTVENGEFFYNIVCINVVIREEGLPESGTIAKLNDVLSSAAKLKEFFGVDSFGEDDEVVIKFPQKGTYEGIVTTNFEKEFPGLNIVIDGNDSTLTGGIVSNGGISGIKNFTLIASDSYKSQYNSNNYKIGLLLDDKTNDVASNKDIHQVHNCLFEGFDYGVLSSGNSLVSGIIGCVFNNCDTGIYENSSNNNYYSDSNDDMFVNCHTGIEIASIPRNNNPYQFIFRNMYFINDLATYCDYKIGCEGKFFYTNNYYGKNFVDFETDCVTNDNVRSAKIEYANPSNTKVYTNPCIRYPESQNEGDKLGIDPTPGLFTGIIAGGDVASKINLNDIANSAIDLCASGTGNQLGVLSFGGNE